MLSRVAALPLRALNWCLARVNRALRRWNDRHRAA